MWDRAIIGRNVYVTSIKPIASEIVGAHQNVGLVIFLRAST
jgi:hypothetical protein